MEGGLREVYFAKECGEIFTHTHFLQIENPNCQGVQPSGVEGELKEKGG